MDLEWFDPNSYISRLLGMEISRPLLNGSRMIDEQDIDVNAMLSQVHTRTVRQLRQ